MHIYIGRDFEDRVCLVMGTMGEVKGFMRKQLMAPEDLLLELYDMPTTKENILQAVAYGLLNGQKEPELGSPLRRWKGTERGGLKEVSIED